jgi:hypothetical protein
LALQDLDSEFAAAAPEVSNTPALTPQQRRATRIIEECDGVWSLSPVTGEERWWLEALAEAKNPAPCPATESRLRKIEAAVFPPPVPALSEGYMGIVRRPVDAVVRAPERMGIIRSSDEQHAAVQRFTHANPEFEGQPFDLIAQVADRRSGYLTDSEQQERDTLRDEGVRGRTSKEESDYR